MSKQRNPIRTIQESIPSIFRKKRNVIWVEDTFASIMTEVTEHKDKFEFVTTRVVKGELKTIHKMTVSRSGELIDEHDC